MDYRTGKCSQCGAEYKVPASFAHNVARCKVCKGVVHLGAPGGAAPTPPPAAEGTPPTPSMPAKKVVPKPAAPRAARPAVPEAKKTPPSAPARPAAASAPAESPAETSERPKGGTLERLKRERQAAGAATPEPTAPARPASPPKPAAPARPSATSARSARPEPAAAPAGKDARASRGKDAEASGRRGDRRGAKKEKKAPVGGILAGAAVVVIGAGVFLFRDKLFGGSTEAAGATEVASSAGAPEAPAPAAPAADAGASREPAPVEDAAEAPPPEEAAAPVEAAKPKTKDPASVDLTAIPDFEPTTDTSADEWSQMNEWMTTWMDVDAGAAGNRAKLSLIGQGRKAVPVILNHFKTLDFATPEGRSNGDQCQKALQQICNGTNFDWKYVDETHPVDDPSDVYFCKRVVELWSNSWKQAEENIEAWIRIAKLDEKDPAEAKRLREMFGGAEPAAEPPSGGGDDDLDVD